MTQPNTDQSQASPEVEVRRRRLLGVGVRADLISAGDLARDLVLANTGTGVDLTLLVGIDNLCQCLAIGLTTLRGTDVFNQRFGFLGLTALTGQTSPVLAREGVRSAVAEFLASDPRVRRIVDLQLDNPMNAPSAGSRVLDVNVRFEAVSGDAASMATGGMASGADWGAIATGSVQAGGASS
jgi:hypothetical protein